MEKKLDCRKLCLISPRMPLHVMEQMTRPSVTSDVAELGFGSEAFEMQ